MTSSAREPAHHASAAHNNYEPTPHSGSYPTPKSSGGSRSLAVPPARWSFLSSPVPDLSLSPAPPSTPFSFYSEAQFEPKYDPEMSGPQEVPQSPGVWGSSSPRREHFDHLSVNESGSRSGGDSSLVDPFFAMISNEGGEGVPMEEDPTLLSISQYLGRERRRTFARRPAVVHPASIAAVPISSFELVRHYRTTSPVRVS